MSTQKKKLVSMVSESYMTDGSLDQYQEHEILSNPEIDESLQELDAHEEAERQLRLVYGVVDSSVQQGMALTPGSAQMVSLVVESLHRRFLKTPYQAIAPALETFDQSHTKHSATKICLEGLGETIKKIGLKVVEIIKRIWDKIKEFFNSFFSKNEAIKSGLKDTQEMIKQLPSDLRANSAMLTFSGVAAENHEYDGAVNAMMSKVPFGISGQCDGKTASKILKDTILLIMMNREIVLDIVECMRKIENTPMNHVGLQSSVEILAHDIKQYMGRLGMKFKKHKGNQTLYAYGHLVDNQHCEVKETIGLSDVYDMPRIFNLDVQIVRSYVETTYQPKVLKKQEMSELVSMALKIMEQSGYLQKIIPIIEKVLHKNTTQLDKVLDNNLYSILDGSSKDLEQSIHALKDLFRYISRNLPKLVTDASRASIAARRYVVLSAQHYKAA